MVRQTERLNMRWPFHHHPPPSKVPPKPAFIRRLDLHLRYNPRSKQPMATATITIVLPTARTDGTSFGPDEIDHTDIFSVGVHNFDVVVNDTTGHMSAASNVASVTVPAVLANPNPATITAVLNP